MTTDASALLDELMGRTRNLLPSEKHLANERRWSDSDVSEASCQRCLTQSIILSDLLGMQILSVRILPARAVYQYESGFG